MDSLLRKSHSPITFLFVLNPFIISCIHLKTLFPVCFLNCPAFLKMTFEFTDECYFTGESCSKSGPTMSEHLLISLARLLPSWGTKKRGAGLIRVCAEGE